MGLTARELPRRFWRRVSARAISWVNVSVDVSSTDVIELCQEKGAFISTPDIEPWARQLYRSRPCRLPRRSNYSLREGVLALRAKYAGGPTAIITHGANPGLVSHFVKQAMVNIARDTGAGAAAPKTRAAWGLLMKKLGIKVIHIAERDTQVANRPKEPGEFVNTWSIDGFFSEGVQPAELGWGTHEKHFPIDGGRHYFGSGCAIYLNRPGCADACAQLDAARGALSRLSDHAWRGDLDPDYFPVPNGGMVRATAHLSLRLSSVRRRGARRCTN